MNMDLQKTRTIIKEIEVIAIELYEKLESEVWDPDVCCLDFEKRNKVEAINQRFHEIYLIAAEFFNEKEK